MTTENTTVTPGQMASTAYADQTSQPAATGQDPNYQATTAGNPSSDSDWTSQMRYVETERPKIGRQPNQLRELLKNTLKAGAIQVPTASLGIKLKSLRTQVVAIAKNFRAISHVVERGDNIFMWLEPKPAGAAYKARAKTPAKTTTAGRKRGPGRPRKNADANR
jgi:hypothetical protein